MKNKLSLTSRIIIAFASGALIAVYFLPSWRIDLFAPQYPEGLSMYIWINKLSGDIDIINGLNHYIGMKKISAEMFPEFKILPFVVAFFIVFGLFVAISGKRKLLFFYVILTLIGGLFIPYDLYQWGYAYGHDLDPTAPIQIPGLSYQPPVIGHKRLLNFDAYSFPDAAGWIVITAAILVTAVWIVEWYKQRKGKLASVAGASIAAAYMMVTLSSCSTQPTPFVSGQDECHVCKMGLADFRFGGEVITRKGKIFKFDDIRCMIDFVKSNTLEEEDIASVVTMDYDRPNQFLDVNKAWFLVSPEISSPMNSNASGYSTRQQAMLMLEGKTGDILSWNELLNRAK